MISNLRSNVAFMMPPDPLRTQGAQDLTSSNRPEADRPPPKQPGDSLVVVAAMIGLAVGGAVGFVLAFLVFGLGFGILSTAGFAVAGAVGGTFIGDAIKKRRYKNNAGNA